MIYTLCQLFSMLVRRLYCVSGVVLFAIPLLSTADDRDIGFEKQINPSQSIEVIEKENRRCIRCHRKERLITNTQAITSTGLHSSDKYLNNCTACHGNKGDHPKNNDHIVPFSDKHTYSASHQNQYCVQCHQAEKLRQSEWTHDVHFNKMVCSNCHTVHKARDPIIGIDRKFRIGLCVFCHDSRNK